LAAILATLASYCAGVIEADIRPGSSSTSHSPLSFTTRRCWAGRHFTARLDLAAALSTIPDCAESYPDAIWPVQAQRAQRGIIHAWHAGAPRRCCAATVPAPVRPGTPDDHIMARSPVTRAATASALMAAVGMDADP
jgi:hypothetical protein